MVNRPKIKGTTTETMLVNYLRDHGWPEAERRTLSGVKDKGDVSGTGPLVWECKYAGGSPKIPAWLLETEVERINAGADFGILVIKPFGLGAKSVGSWYAVMNLGAHEALIARALGCEVIAPEFPQPYSARKLQLQFTALNGARSGRRQEGNDTSFFVAPTMMPPGAQDKPERHYRVMHLWEMVGLLHAAGYYRQGLAPATGQSASGS